MNKEYIEREVIVAFLENMAASRYLIQCFENKERFPAADVVEVTYCKNCKLRGKEDCPMAYYLELEGDYVDPTEDYDFCSYGERKETNNV